MKKQSSFYSKIVQKVTKDKISNPENAEFVNEVAFNEGIEPSKVTQKMFNERYLKESVPQKSKVEELPTPKEGVKTKKVNKPDSFYNFMK